VRQTPFSVRFVKNMTEDICMGAVVHKDWHVIIIHRLYESIHNCFTDKVISALINYDGYALKYIDQKEITYDLCLSAVKNKADALEFVPEKFKTEELCLIAVKNSGSALKYIENQTDELCKIAMTKYDEAQQYIKNQTEELCIISVRKNGKNLRYVKNLTIQICLEAIYDSKDNSLLYP